MVEIIEKGQYHTGDFSEELTSAEEGNRHIGTKLLFRNDEVGVWEVRLSPEKGRGFTFTTAHYFWRCPRAGWQATHCCGV